MSLQELNTQRFPVWFSRNGYIELPVDDILVHLAIAQTRCVYQSSAQVWATLQREDEWKRDSYFATALYTRMTKHCLYFYIILSNLSARVMWSLFNFWIFEYFTRARKFSVVIFPLKKRQQLQNVWKFLSIFPRASCHYTIQPYSYVVV